MPRIGEVIKEYRVNSGISQQRLGEDIGLNASHRQRISDWESGARTPSAEHLLRIMSVLKIPPEAFDEYREAGEQ